MLPHLAVKRQVTKALGKRDRILTIRSPFSSSGLGFQGVLSASSSASRGCCNNKKQISGVSMTSNSNKRKHSASGDFCFSFFLGGNSLVGEIWLNSARLIQVSHSFSFCLFQSFTVEQSIICFELEMLEMRRQNLHFSVCAYTPPKAGAYSKESWILGGSEQLLSEQ